jgi:hypothetical protein
MMGMVVVHLHHLHLLCLHLSTCLIWLSLGLMLPNYMMTMMAAMPRHGERHEIVGCSLANLFRHNSLVFDGSARPLATENCISNFQNLVNALVVRRSTTHDLRWIGKPANGGRPLKFF